MRFARGSMVAGALCFASAAQATDVQQFPGQGTQGLGRGGAWVARATGPLATYYNPAGLAGQLSGVTADVALAITSTCFERAGQGSRLDFGGDGVPYPGEVCDDSPVQPLPSLGGVLRVTERLGLGLMVAPPTLYGARSFPDTVAGKNDIGIDVQLPAPTRYLLLESKGIVLNTTLGAGFELMDDVRVGAGFVWGLASYTLANANQSVAPRVAASDGLYLDPVTSDVRAQIDVSDLFMPGFVVGVLVSPHSMLDVGLRVKTQEAFDGRGDLETRANYWSPNGVSKDPVVGSSSESGEDLAHFRLPNPLEIQVGVRFHLPREGSAAKEDERDPLEDDVFDVEIDLSYARNSAYDAARLRFPESPIILVKGTGGRVPQNGDVPLRMRGDTLGLRVGGDVTVIPGTLALRAGGWYEPDVQRPESIQLSMLGSRRIGVALGGQYRLGPVDLEAAAMHVMFADVDNGGRGRTRVVSGDATTQPTPFRSPYGINGGRISQSSTIVSLGGTMRF